MAEETAGLISGPAPELDPAERRLLAAMPLHAITTDKAITVLSQVDGLGISFDPSHLQVTTAMSPTPPGDSARTSSSPLNEPGQPVDVTARITRRQVVHGLINEYHRAA